MKNVAKSAVTSGRDYTFSSDGPLEGYETHYPLIAVKSCHYEGELIRENEDEGQLWIRVKGKAELEVYDTRTGIPFLYPTKIQEKAQILDDEDGEGEGYIVSGPNIDLDGLVLRILESSLPLQLLKNPDEPLPKSKDPSVHLMSEDERKEEKGNFSLDGLPEFPDAPKKDS
jgi:hypothetical protein